MGAADAVPSLSLLYRSDVGAGELEGIAWDARGTYAARWDKVDGSPDADHGDIGEDARGVWAKRHPLALLAEEPALWPMVHRYRRTGLDSVTREDDQTLSAFDLSVHGLVVQAHQRAVAVRMGARHGPQT